MPDLDKMSTQAAIGYLYSIHAGDGSMQEMPVEMCPDDRAANPATEKRWVRDLTPFIQDVEELIRVREERAWKEGLDSCFHVRPPDFKGNPYSKVVDPE